MGRDNESEDELDSSNDEREDEGEPPDINSPTAIYKSVGLITHSGRKKVSRFWTYLSYSQLGNSLRHDSANYIL